MDYAKQLEYYNYLLECMNEEESMNACIQEALVLSEGVDVVNKITAINEGVMDKIKETWGKFIAFVKKVFGRFTEAMSKVLDSDKGYLEKYSKIIKEKPFKLEVSAKNYNMQRVMAADVPLFNYSTLREKLDSKSKFMNSIISDFPVDGNTDDLNGWCKAYFCNGSEEEVDLKINITELYDYCHDFKDKMYPNLNKNVDAINKSWANASSLINTAIANKKKADDAAKTTATTTKVNQTGEVKEGDTVEKLRASAVIGSRLLDRVISEADDNGEEIKVPVGVDIAKNAAMPVTGPNKTDTEEVKTPTAADDISSGELSTEKATEILSTYTTVASAITGCKLTAAKGYYDLAMRIIRAHVQMYIGNPAGAPKEKESKPVINK